MAIKKGNDENQNQGGTPMGDAFEQAQAKPGQQQTPPPGEQNGSYQSSRRKGSFMDLNSLMRRPVSRKSTGEVVVRFQDALKKQIERNLDQNFQSAFSLQTLDNNTNNVPLSSILLCYHEKINGKDYLAVYTLLIEGSGPKLKSRTLNIGGRNIEIDTVAGDILNDYLWGKIVDYLNSVYGKQMEVMDAGAMVIPEELDPEDDEHVRRILFNSSQACFTVLETTLGLHKEEVFSVSLINNPSDSLVARLDYNPGSAESATAEPIRSDIRVTLQGSLGNQNPEAGFEQTRDITTVDGYIDLYYVEPPRQQVPGQPPVTQHYYPRLVMTRADTEVDAVTMELQLLSLSTTTLLSRGMAWAGVFRPRHGVKGVDTKDIGAIGYEVNLAGDPNSKPDRVDTKAQDFDINKLYQLISMSMHDDLVYSMDIEEVGEMSWIHQAFIAAANDNPEAHQLILDSANNLTEGAFGQIFPGGKIANDDNTRIHMGYYIGEDGKEHDIREIDYLALLNLVGEKDPQLLVRWGESFDNTSIPLEVRLEERANILKGVLGQNMHLKGYARRITFNPDFLIALNMASARAGLVIRPDNLIQEFMGTGMRGNANIANYGISSSQVQNLFNYSPQNPWGGYTQGGFGGPFHGRFGR